MKTKTIIAVAILFGLGSLAAALKIHIDSERVYAGLYNEYRRLGENKYNTLPEDLSAGFDEPQTGTVAKVLMGLPHGLLVAVQLVGDGTYVIAQIRTEEAGVGESVIVEKLTDIPAIAFAKRP